ncbi:MAG: extracellular solute-binding protein [Paenibacillaceae bacterium]|jgi:putative aldouronate transport system substrate-binding protein|nr:extracellular solute-binding protein [Paenibacillaceae bacterium]
MKIRYSVLLASALACTALVAGCSSNDDPKDAAPSAGTAAEPKKNITVSIYDRGLVPPAEGTIEDNRWTKWLNQNGPVNVKFMAIPRFESVQKYNTLFASGGAPDLIFEYDSAYRNQLYTQKQLLPLDDLIEQYGTNYKKMIEKYPKLKSVGTKADGKIYELGRVNELNPNHTLFIRADWLKKLNLEVPKTLEDFMKVAKAFSEQDPDGNGKKDTYGIALSFVSGYIMDYAFGAGTSWAVVDGKLEHVWDRVKASYEFRKQLFNAGVVDKDFLADTNGEKSKQDWLSGKLGIYGANGGASDKNLLEAFVKNNPNADYIPIAPPETPFGKFGPVIQNPLQMVAAITSSAKNPEAVMKYYDFLLSDKAVDALRNGIEGEHYAIVDGCPTPVDDAKNKVERVYMTDFQMVLSADPSNKCAGWNIIENPIFTDKTTEAEKNLLNKRAAIAKEAYRLYIDKDRPMGALTHGEHMPALPQELQIIVTNANKAMSDIWAKSVVENSYTSDMALKDVQAAWEKAGGAKVDDFYVKWYDSSKDSAFLTKNMYDFASR